MSEQPKPGGLRLQVVESWAMPRSVMDNALDEAIRRAELLFDHFGVQNSEEGQGRIAEALESLPEGDLDDAAVISHVETYFREKGYSG